MAALALPGHELQYIAEIGSGDEPARKIYASYQQFHTLITDWSDISEAGRAEQPGCVRIISSAPTSRQTICCDCSRPLLARSGGEEMSAFAPLVGAKRTSISVVNL